MKMSGLSGLALFSLFLVCVSIAGCDWLGLGSKKQDNAQSQPAASPTAPAAPAPAVQNISDNSGPLPGNALVRIGKWTLTAEEFNDRVALLKQQLPDFKADDANSKKAVLEELVRQQLLVDDAENSGLADTKEVKDAVEDFRKTLLVQELAGKLTKEIAATEDDARVYYDANKSKFAEPVKWSVREIIVADEATAKGLLVQILQGADFAQLAQAQSKGATAADGGKLKPFTSAKAPFEAMDTAIANLEEGGVSAAFKGPQGYYIVKVDSKTGGMVKSFAEIKKDLIYGLTLQKQQEKILSHLRDLAQKDKPEYNQDLIVQVVGK